jgi:hypothetical protein
MTIPTLLFRFRAWSTLKRDQSGNVVERKWVHKLKESAFYTLSPRDFDDPLIAIHPRQARCNNLDVKDTTPLELLLVFALSASTRRSRSTFPTVSRFPSAAFHSSVRRGIMVVNGP